MIISGRVLVAANDEYSQQMKLNTASRQLGEKKGANAQQNKIDRPLPQTHPRECCTEGRKTPPLELNQERKCHVLQ